jgi:hypothetical protein
MKSRVENQIRVMRVIARMNLGGPAIQVSGLMRGLSEPEFEQRLYTGYCDGKKQAYYHESIAREEFLVIVLGRLSDG